MAVLASTTVLMRVGIILAISVLAVGYWQLHRRQRAFERRVAERVQYLDTAVEDIDTTLNNLGEAEKIIQQVKGWRIINGGKALLAGAGAAICAKRYPTMAAAAALTAGAVLTTGPEPRRVPHVTAAPVPSSIHPEPAATHPPETTVDSPAPPPTASRPVHEHEQTGSQPESTTTTTAPTAEIQLPADDPAVDVSVSADELLPSLPLDSQEPALPPEAELPPEQLSSLAEDLAPIFGQQLP